MSKNFYFKCRNVIFIILANNLFIIVKNNNTMIHLFKDPFFNTIDDMFDSTKFRTSPQVNVTKTEFGYKVLMSVPGLTKDDLKITIKDSILKISYLKEDKDETSHFVNSFSKSYSLPETIKEKDIEGKVENGILEILLPLDKKKPSERVLSLN